ncbi:MAG: cytochrome c [Bdellovibrionales bacterium]
MNNNRDEYNRGGLIAFVGSVTFCLLFFIYISFIHPGVDLKEVTAAVASPDATLAGASTADEIDISKIEKPWIENNAVVAHGLKIYKTNCAICHGDEGKGNGPAGLSLQPPPRNFVEGKWKKGGQSAELFATISEGLPGTSMAGFKHLPKADRWALVLFIRSITQNKVADDMKKLESFAPGAQ